ncbi:MAG: M23 family metallopeptidase [Spirochaetota bacterium]
MKRFTTFYFLLFLVSSISAGEKIKVRYKKTAPGTFAFFADNPNPVTYWLKFEFTKLKNLRSNTKTPLQIVIPPNKKNVRLLTLKAINTSKSVSFRNSYFFDIGNPYSAKHDDSTTYLFPFPHGKKYMVSQGYHGLFTHKGWQAYATDFQLPTGSLITAARAGKVVQVVQHNTRGGNHESFAKYANRILILHNDGTIANYFHLQKNGSLVKQGDEVIAGQKIGYSGNTGYSQGPHLHFHISLPQFSSNPKTVAVLFLDHTKQRVEAKTGSYYYSMHPGKPEFPIDLGKNIKVTDYSSYRKEVFAKPEKVIMRNITKDNTILFFIRNQFSKTCKIKVRFTNLKNTQLEILQKGTLLIPKNTEVFYGLARPKDASKAWSPNYSYSYYLPISKSGSESSLEPGDTSKDGP